MIRTVEIMIPETAGAVGQVDALAMCQSAAAEARNYAENAAQWLTGAGAPSNSLGVESQLYLDTDTGDMWKKGPAVWALIAQLTPDLAPTTALAQQGVDGAVAAQADADTANAAIAALVIPVAGSGASQVPTNTIADAKYAPIAHASNTSNPHSTTKAQVGLGNVTDTAQLPASYLDTDTTLAANSDTKVASQKAVKAYVSAAVGAVLPGHGDCRLALVSTNLVLKRDGPGFLVINGVTQVVPVAGVSLSPTGQAPGTLYNIYSYMNGATMTLEASTTGHSQDATTGVEIKTGDPTRTLVGMARCVTGPAWVDTAAQRFVISYFNRKTVGAQNKFASSRSTASATVVELSSSERAEFLCWADEDVLLSSALSASNSTSGSAYAYVTVDGTTLIDGAWALFYQPAGGYNLLSIPATPTRLTEGYHYATVCARSASAGTLSFLGASTAGERCTVQAILRG